MASWTYIDGDWHEGNVPMMGSMSPSSWLASVVFDGARAFDGVTPDLDKHCERAITSARKLGMDPKESVDELVGLSLEALGRFDPGAPLYIRPMFMAEAGFLVPDPAGTRFALVVFDLPFPDLTGFSACLSSFRRPSPETAITEAKASALYPNVARALKEAQAKGFDTGIKLDLNGNVAEFATANLFMVKDGVVSTPVANGTFLDGITKHRVMGLLREDGVEVQERRLVWDDLLEADELFNTGNYGKVTGCVRLEDRDLGWGPVTTRAKDLYFEWARSG